MTLVLTTDAGMPGVSDPGAGLVAAAREAGMSVEVLPGPSAVTAALAVAGVEAPGFVFAGFLPARPAGERRRALEKLLAAARGAGLPLVLYESPRRVRSLLELLQAQAPGCRVAVCRELTKLHEEVLVGTVAEAASALVEERGEFVVVAWRLGPAVTNDAAELPVGRLVAAGRRAGLSNRTLLELLRGAGLGRRDAYRLLHSDAGEAATVER